MLDGKIYLTFDIYPEFYTNYYTDQQVTKKKTDKKTNLMKFSNAAQTDLYMTSKYCESYKEQMALYAFQSLSWYLDVIHDRSAVPLQFEHILYLMKT